MNWFKTSSEIIIKDYSDRNRVNASIHVFKNMISQLNWASRVVFQSANAAGNVSSEIVEHVKLSSYPIIRNMVIEADRVVRDSPWKFSALCILAADELRKKVKQLEKARHEFITGKDKKQNNKGWR